MLHLVQRIFLGHKLGELVGEEEISDRRHKSPIIDNLRRRQGGRVGRGHPVLNVSFHFGHIRPQSLL